MVEEEKWLDETIIYSLSPLNFRWKGRIVSKKNRAVRRKRKYNNSNKFLFFLFSFNFKNAISRDLLYFDRSEIDLSRLINSDPRSSRGLVISFFRGTKLSQGKEEFLPESRPRPIIELTSSSRFEKKNATEGFLERSPFNYSERERERDSNLESELATINSWC